MAKLLFKYTDPEFIESNREASQIEFVVPDEMNITEFKIICMRLASAMGYHQQSIKKAFGEIEYEKPEVDGIKQLLNEINNKKID